ncbi:hypothetical protein AB1F87_003567 [Vibrio mimicus]
MNDSPQEYETQISFCLVLSKRFIIETININDQLKNISQIEHSRHR